MDFCKLANVRVSGSVCPFDESSVRHWRVGVRCTKPTPGRLKIARLRGVGSVCMYTRTTSQPRPQRLDKYHYFASCVRFLFSLFSRFVSMLFRVEVLGKSRCVLRVVFLIIGDGFKWWRVGSSWKCCVFWWNGNGMFCYVAWYDGIWCRLFFYVVEFFYGFSLIIRNFRLSRMINNGDVIW